MAQVIDMRARSEACGIGRQRIKEADIEIAVDKAGAWP